MTCTQILNAMATVKNTIMISTLIKITALILITTLNACSKYDFRVNNAVIYEPATLFNDFALADKNLHTCVTQTILDQDITSQEQLSRLICTSAGIKSLMGLATFTQLQQLNLNSNQLQTLNGIASLSKLEILDVSENRLIDAGALLSLLSLQRLNIEDNSALSCNDLNQLAQHSQAQLKLPKQCI